MASDDKDCFSQRLQYMSNSRSLLIHFQLGHAHLPSLLAGVVGFVAECADIAD